MPTNTITDTAQMAAAIAQDAVKGIAGSAMTWSMRVGRALTAAGATFVATLAEPEEHAQTKDDLYQQARELNIEGRSKMTRDELEAAVAAAQRS